MTARSNRREFLAAGAVALAAAARPGVGYAANDAVSIGAIGTGGRCRQLMKSLGKVPGVRVTAVADIWDVSLNNARPLADTKALVTKSYKELLDRKDVDAVVIGSPDHWHVPMTVDACAAGKDVYVEKPLTHKPSEAAAVMHARNKYRRIVQVGTQQRSMPHFQKAAELIKAGRIGRVHKIHLTWNRNVDRVRRFPLGVDPKTVDWKAFLGNAPDQPFDEYRFRNWRWFWDFGGGIFTDLMVHFIDVAHWFLDLDRPVAAVSIGSHLAAKGVWETPDTVQTLLTYKDGLQAYFEGTFVNARNGAMIEFMGSDGTLYLDRGRYEIHPERGIGKYEELILSTQPARRGADFYDKPDGELLHLTNWVECLRSRNPPNCPAEAGVSAASAAHLANAALRSGQKAEWKE
jgi:predicted dehydrogenase